MHCIKTINIEYEYGTVRLFLLTGITFIVVFCLSYVLSSLSYSGWHTDRYFSLFMIAWISIYPIHKFIHYVSLFHYRKSLSFRLKIKFTCVPILTMRIQEIIPRHRYLWTLIAPCLVLNIVLLIGIVYWPAFAHYFCLLLAFHCGICVLDLLHFKDIWSAPKNAVIEETPKGYEVLVPQY